MEVGYLPQDNNRLLPRAIQNTSVKDILIALSSYLPHKWFNKFLNYSNQCLSIKEG